MTQKVVDPLATLLFGQDRQLVNFKMQRGDAPFVLEADLRDEAHAALLQVSLQTCDTHENFPEDNSHRVDVATLA